MYAGTIYEIFILPITFKSVSFHHRANYSIKIFQLETHEFKSTSVRPDCSISSKAIDPRTGNMIGVGAEVTKDGTLTTERFQIDYNEQSVNFTTGMWLQVTLQQEQKTLPLKLELYRIDVVETKDGISRPILNPIQKKVSQELLYVNLQPLEEAQGHNHYRKLIFPSCQYISFIDLGCISFRRGPKVDFSKIYYDDIHEELFIEENTMVRCCLAQKRIKDTENFLKQIYTVAIRDKLRVYQDITVILQEKIKEFKQRARHHRHTLKITKKWTQQWVKTEIPNLRYLDVSNNTSEREELMQSCIPFNREKDFQLSYLLCHHFDCYLHQLTGYLAQESLLIDLNIQATFQRIIQLLAILGPGAAVEIAVNEKKRVEGFLELGRQEGKKYSLEEGIPDENFQAYTKNVHDLLMGLPNFSILQEKQPLLMISGDSEIGQKIDISKTVTILVHGFRGNEFDLSKLKSYLNLFLGFSHFYAVRSITTGQGTDANISKLGQLAGEEVNKYLQMHMGIKYVNVIGFSLGGVIARSMLTHLKAHQAKFNLLLTLASPHLGMHEIESCLVRMGLFYMRRVAKVESIQDLNNEHTTDSNRYLHQLANCRMITSFRWVILVGSSEDDYVPCYSSLCNYNGDNELIRQLSNSFNERVGVIRCNVKIKVQESLMDKLTRRRVHISLLEDDSFIRMLVVRFQHFFTHTR